MAIDKASLIIIEGNQLPDATTVESLAILLSNPGVAQMPKMLMPEVRFMATKAAAIKAVVMVMVMITDRPVVKLIPWMPMSSMGI